MSKLMVKDGDIWVPMEGLKGDTGPLPADESIPDTALVTDGAKTNTAYLMRNRLTKDAEGELISVEDAYAVPPVSLSADGVSTQVTTTGKNLFDKDGDCLGYYKYDTGEYISNTRYRYFRISVAEGDVVRMSPMASTAMSTYLNGTYVGTPGVGVGTYTIPSGVDEISGYFLDTYWKTAIVTKNNSDLTYEPYSGRAASPRPDWPQEITSIDEVAVLFGGANLRLSENGATVGKYLDVDGNEVSNARRRYTTYLPVIDGKVTVYSSYNQTIRTGASSRSYWYDASKGKVGPQTVGNGTLVVKGMYEWTLTAPSGAAYIRISIQGSSSLYQGMLTTLDLSEEPLRSMPDGTKDELHLTYIRPSTREGWAYYRSEKIKRIGAITFNTFATFASRPNANANDFRPSAATIAPAAVFKSTSSGNKNRMMCNSFVSYSDLTTNRTSGLNGRCSYQKTYRYAWFRLDADEYPDLATANAWLAENPITILLEYEDAYVETIDLGIFELPAMQSGTTHLWTDPSTNLSVTYERDRNIVITNLKAAVADLATS